MNASAPGQSVEAFLDQLAVAVPTPGGGAAAALAAAAAAALATMVCGVALKRAESARLREAQKALELLRAELLVLITEDVKAYEAVLAARGMPEAERANALPNAMLHATTVPLQLAEASAKIVELCACSVDDVRASTLGDLAVAVCLAGAALDGATLTALINLREVRDARFTERARRRLQELHVTKQRANALRDAIAARSGLTDWRAG